MLEFTNIRLAQLDSNNIIQVYGHKDTLNMLNISEGEMHLGATEPIPNMRKFYDIKSLEFYNTFQIGDYKVTTIPSNHLLQKVMVDSSESMQGANFIIEYKNETLLYAVDKDVYSESTLDFVKNFKFDKIIINCNDRFFGKKSNHQNINEVNDFLHYLYRFNSIDMETPIYLPHITHNMSHFEFEKRLKDFTLNIKLAYDGLDIV